MICATQVAAPAELRPKGVNLGSSVAGCAVLFFHTLIERVGYREYKKYQNPDFIGSGARQIKMLWYLRVFAGTVRVTRNLAQERVGRMIHKREDEPEQERHTECGRRCPLHGLAPRTDSGFRFA